LALSRTDSYKGSGIASIQNATPPVSKHVWQHLLVRQDAELEDGVGLIHEESARVDAGEMTLILNYLKVYNFLSQLTCSALACSPRDNLRTSQNP
jgi:hypothetical protein